MFHQRNTAWYIDKAIFQPLRNINGRILEKEDQS
jgi:hypothetical protein